MKIIKRLVIFIVLYLVWKEVGFPILIVGAAFFGPFFVKNAAESDRSFIELRQHLIYEFGVWLNEIDPNTFVYASALLLAIILVTVLILTFRRLFSLSSKQEGGQLH